MDVLLHGTEVCHRQACDEIKKIMSGYELGSVLVRHLHELNDGRPFLFPNGKGVSRIAQVLEFPPYADHIMLGGGVELPTSNRPLLLVPPDAPILTRTIADDQDNEAAVLLRRLLARPTTFSLVAPADGTRLAIGFDQSRVTYVLAKGVAAGGAGSLGACLKALVEDRLVTKVVHGLWELAPLLEEHWGWRLQHQIIDLQLIAESLGRPMHVSLADLHAEVVSQAAHSQAPLWRIGPALIYRFGEALQKLGFHPVSISVASTRRAQYALDKEMRDKGRPVVYLKDKKRFGSAELWESLDPARFHRRPMTISHEVESLVDLVPPDLLENRAVCLDDGFRHRLLEIVLDQGRRPRAKLAQVPGQHYLHQNESVLVTAAHVQALASRLRVGFDNRAGINGCLHRISFMRDREGAFYGATLRLGRHITGNVEFLRDILTSEASQAPSVLIMGAPGAGKTTIIRELARLLTMEMLLEVVIVDTSNEIAGDGVVPHPSVGDARRMMVQTREDQAKVMIECVQNHSPQVMIVDEIGRKREVEAASTVKERGVAVVGSAHGDLESLLRNQELMGLLGGSRSTVIGDMAAREKGTKVLKERAHAPVFNVVVELKTGSGLRVATVYKDVARVVDAIYAGKAFDYEERCVNEHGQVFVKCGRRHPGQSLKS